MKSRAASLLFLSVIILLLCLGTATGEEGPVFVLPAGLVEIEEEAFSGTAVQNVVLPDGLQSVGDNAFENTEELKDVYVPSSVETLSDSAFPENGQLVIHGTEGSAAQKWAEKHRVAFAPRTAWRTTAQDEKPKDSPDTGIGLLQKGDGLPGPMNRFSRARADGKSMRPQDRAELNPIDYKFP